MDFTRKNVDTAKRLLPTLSMKNRNHFRIIFFMMPQYDYFGRVDFIKLTEKLLKEETEYGKVRDSKAWIQEPAKCITAEHEFITSDCKTFKKCIC